MDQKYNLAHFLSKLDLEIDPSGILLCLKANETFNHLMTDCEVTTSLQMDIMKNQIPLPDMSWSVKDKQIYSAPTYPLTDDIRHTLQQQRNIIY